jgi:hypothetical protein
MPLEKITPRGDGEGSIGSASKTWGKGYFDNLHCAESFKYPLTTFAQRPAFDLEPGQTLFDIEAGALTVWDGSDWIVLSGSNLVAINVLAENGGTAEGGGTYNKGSPAIIKAIPDDGYEFDSWIGDSLDIDNTSLYQTFITPEESATVTATFKPKSYDINLSSNNPEYGIVSLNQREPYNHGEIVTITAEPTNPNFYEFVGWSGLGADLIDTTQAEVKFSLTQEISLIAEFRILSYDVNISTTFNDAAGNFAGITMYEYGNEFNIFNLSGGDGTYSITLPSTTRFTIALVPNNPSIEVRGASSESEDPNLQFVPQSGDSPYDFIHYDYNLGSNLDINIAINVLSFDTTLVPTDLDMEYLFSEDNEGAKPKTTNETNPILHLSPEFPGGVNTSTDLASLTHLSFLFEFLSGIDLNDEPIPDDNMPTISPGTTPTASNGLQGITFSNIQYNATYTVKVKNTIDVVALNVTDINQITLTENSSIGGVINVQGNEYTIVENDLVYDSTNTEFYYFKKGESNEATLERYNGPVYDFEEVTNGEFVEGAFRERLLNTGNELLYNDSNKTFTFKGLDQPQSLLLRWKTYPFAKISSDSNAFFGFPIYFTNSGSVSRRVSLESEPTFSHSTFGHFTTESWSVTSDGSNTAPSIFTDQYIRLNSGSYLEFYDHDHKLGNLTQDFVVFMRLGSLPNSNNLDLFSRGNFRITLSSESDLSDPNVLSLGGEGFFGDNKSFDFGVTGDIGLDTFIVCKFSEGKHYGAALSNSGEVVFNSSGTSIIGASAPSSANRFRIGSDRNSVDSIIKDIVFMIDQETIRSSSIETLANDYFSFFKREKQLNQLSWSPYIYEYFNFQEDSYPNLEGNNGIMKGALINGNPNDFQKVYTVQAPDDSSNTNPEIQINLTVTNNHGLSNSDSKIIPIGPAPVTAVEEISFVTKIVNYPGGEELLKAPIIVSTSVETTLINGYTITE